MILVSDSFDQFEGKTLLFCGDGAAKASKIIQFDKAEYIPSIAEANSMSALAYTSFIAKKYEDLAYYVPFYLKPPNVTKSKKFSF